MIDEDILVGAPLPRIKAVTPQDGLRVGIIWDEGKTDSSMQVVDLAPVIYRYKLYAPLRDDSTLFRTIEVTDDGFAVAWNREDIDMASTTIAELATQTMTSADFIAFIKRNGYTLDSVAADLGISRRLAAYYAKEREIPRYIALACSALTGRSTGRSSSDR